MTPLFNELVTLLTGQSEWYYKPEAFWTAIGEAKLANPKLVKWKSKVSGLGVFTKEDIKAHEVLLRYPGVFSLKPVETGYNIACHGNYLHVEQPVELAHYINSSFHFAPNCVFVPHVNKQGDRIVAVVTLRPLLQGEELFCRYICNWQKGKGYAEALLPHLKQPQPFCLYNQQEDDKIFEDIISAHPLFYGPYYVVTTRKRKYASKPPGKKERMKVHQWVPFVSWGMLRKKAKVLAIHTDLDMHQYKYFDTKEKNPLASWFLIETYEVNKTKQDKGHKLGPIPLPVGGEWDRSNAVLARDFLLTIGKTITLDEETESEHEPEPEPEPEEKLVARLELGLNIRSPLSQCPSPPTSPINLGKEEKRAPTPPPSPEIHAVGAPRVQPRFQPRFTALNALFDEVQEGINPLLLPYFRDIINGSSPPTPRLEALKHAFREMSRNFIITPKNRESGFY